MFLRKRRKKRRKVRNKLVAFFLIFSSFLLFSYDFEIFLSAKSDTFLNEFSRRLVREDFFGRDAVIDEKYDLRATTGGYLGIIAWIGKSWGVYFGYDKVDKQSDIYETAYTNFSDEYGNIYSGRYYGDIIFSWSAYDIDIVFDLMNKGDFRVSSFLGLTIWEGEFEYPIRYDLKYDELKEKIVLDGIIFGKKEDRLYGFNVGVIARKMVYKRFYILGGASFKSTKVGIDRTVEIYVLPYDAGKGSYKILTDIEYDLRPFSVFGGVGYEF